MNPLRKLLPYFFPLFLFLSLFFNKGAEASHGQGADLTYECISPNKYKVTLKFYRDCGGISAPSSPTVNISSASCGENLSLTLSQVSSQEVTPICPSENTTCTGGSKPGTEEYIYEGTITLPQKCDDWIFEYSICCRNTAITNIENPGSEQIHVQSTLNNLDHPCSSSPTFSNPPVPYICEGEEYCFNHGAQDPDGDSLYYSLVTPSTSSSGTVTYKPGYSASQPLSSSPPVSIDNQTGDICMTPTAQEVTVMEVEVEKWRDGDLVGVIHRDIQVRVVSCSNNTPYLKGMDGTGDYSMKVCAGNNIDFNIPSFDDDSGDSLSLSWNNGIPSGTFDPGTGDRPTGNFQWTPTSADVSSVPHCFTVTVEDDNCPIIGSQTYSFCITVIGIDSLNFVVDSASCGNADGSATVDSIYGGVKPYTYQWGGNAGNQTGATANNLSPGTYEVEVTDSTGCTIKDSVTVPGAIPPVATIADSTNVTCSGGSDGEAIASASGGSPPYSYQWSNGQIGTTATSLNEGLYYVIVEDDESCRDTADVLIEEPEPWYVESSNDSSNCGSSDGAAYVDSVSGNTPGYSFQWNGPGNSQTGPDATNILPGNHDVTITDTNGCDTTVTIKVPIRSGHSTSIGSKTDVSCFGGSDGEATAQVSGGTSPYDYQWNDPKGQTNQTATGLTQGTYKVVVTDANGCKDSAEVTINEPSPLDISSNSDTTICQGGVATLSASASGGTPPYTYHWDNGAGTGQTVTVSPGSNSFYGVYAVDANACTSSTASVRVQYHPSLSVDALSDDSICPGKTSSLSAIGSGGSGSGYSYSWSNGDQGINTVVSPSSDRTYTVTLEDNCETPAAKDSVRVSLYELPDVQIGGNDLEDCAPVNATLINETHDGMVGSECLWDFGDGVTGSGCDSVMHRYETPGCYDVGLTVRSPEGCVDSNSIKDFVCVRPYPEANFDFDPEESTVQDPLFEFTNLSNGATDYAWAFGDMDSSYREHPSYSFPEDSAGEYQVCLEASSRYACKDTTCSTISIGGEMIVYVPNAFTPDGDGINDRFAPVVQGIDPSDYHFYIYDRWGEVVFESHHPEKKWDGSIKGSEKASKTDVYVWQLQVTNKHTGEEVEKKGHVTLIR